MVVQQPQRRPNSEYAVPRAVDEWALSVKDLHRVLKVANSLFLTLTQHDEGLVRVALELITSKKSKHIFKWYEDWYDDDVRRNWFHREVQDQLKYVIAIRDRRTPEKTSGEEEEAELRAALKRAAEAEAALDAMRSDTLNAARLEGFSESEKRQSKEALQHKSEQIASLQERLRQANAAVQTAEDQCRSLDAHLQDTARSKADVESRCNQILSRIHGLEEEVSALRMESGRFKQEAASHQQAAVKSAEEVAALRRQLDALKGSQTEAAALQRRIQELTAEVQTHKAEAAAAQAKEAECEALRVSTANAVRRASGLESEVQSLRSQYDALAAKYSQLEAEHSALSASNKELSQRPEPAAKVARPLRSEAVQTDAVEPAKPARTLVEEPTAAERRKSTQGDSDATAAALEESRRRNAELKAENKRLTVALEELQQKMKDLMAACRRQGVDIDAIAEAIGLDCFHNLSVFERLYNEAQERVYRMEKRRNEFYQAHKYDYFKGANIIQQLEQSQLVEYYAPAQRDPSHIMGSEAPVQMPQMPPARGGGPSGAGPEDFASAGEAEAPMHMNPATLAAVLSANSRMAKGQHSLSADQLKASSGFARKGRLATGVHTHVVAPRAKSRGCRSKMGSSLGFSKATHIIASQTKMANKSKMGSSLGFSKATRILASQTKLANATDGDPYHAGGQPSPRMRATKSETKLPRHTDESFGPRQRDRKATGMGNSVSLPSLAREKFRQTQ